MLASNQIRFSGNTAANAGQPRVKQAAANPPFLILLFCILIVDGMFWVVQMAEDRPVLQYINLEVLGRQMILIT
ncbi:hypothetical protein OSB04_001461 [Centaurea solstitialis]|uniref:Uncharacterized protein n=1 Tax=Centaurea solstitialis TaxID=347529 RepID=A0AA38U2R0_9ASTR|nr:hypothetical protein OSB04_001461 [Centaurea solstitialis]